MKTAWKAVARRSVVFLAILTGFVVLSATSTMAGTFLGEFCWSVTINEDETGPITPQTFPARMGVTNMGGNYFTLQGLATSPSGTSVLQGTGVLSGGQVLMNLTRSESSPGSRDSGIIHFTLNASSLNGSLSEIGHYFNTTSRQFSTYYSGGNVTFMPSCP